MEHDDPHTSQTTSGATFEAILARRIARRSVVKGAIVGGSVLAVGASLSGLLRNETEPDSGALTFQPIPLDDQDRVLVPSGYQSQVLIRWGDPLFSNAPAFNVNAQTPAAQAQQFGVNCDYVAYRPLPDYKSHSPNTGLLVVNHEFTSPELMFPGYVPASPTKDQVDIELAAHGVSVVRIDRFSTGWRYVLDSPFNRRITMETPIRITGPAAGHSLLQVSYDPTGTRVRGTLNNCAGGTTPWGTVLTCEENFNYYFANLSTLSDSDPRKAIHTRYGLLAGASGLRWELFHDRFDLAKEPNEPFRFGWVVEIDPYNPDFLPQKRTALGRMKHECATTVVAPDGRVVVYSGDDERFNYFYKFVTQGRFNRKQREANFNLLDMGTLYVARLNDDGSGEWIPLIGGQKPLAAWSQAEVLINTRGAADLVGATKMDRPEDIETNPANGKVYGIFTNNTWRGTGSYPGTDAANPRAKNRHGHVIEFTEAGDDPTATTFTWEIFLLCGDPNTPADTPTFFAGFDPSQVSSISSPDNCVFDRAGNLWIATDGQPTTFGKNDGFYAVPVAGSQRGFLRRFLSVPTGAETCGPAFTPNDETLFIAVQHPGRTDGSTLSNPSSRWPDGDIPRPSVVAVVKTGRGSKVIGT